MNRNRDILRIILAVLIAVFLMLGIGIVVLTYQRNSQKEELRKEQVKETLEKTPTRTPSPTVTPTSTPTPTPTVTPTPTPVPTKVPSFDPTAFLGLWYSGDGLVSIDVYSLNKSSVSFFMSQANKDGIRVSESDVTAEVAGNAAQLEFYDSFGSSARGSMIFDSDGLYVNIETVSQAESVCPSVSGMLTREEPQIQWEPTPTPTAAPVPTKTPGAAGDYFFPESDGRYLTDEELSGYSSSDLELAKNEIYARHGRQFVTERIADYFNGKSWYEGSIDPETFDSMQDEIFNEYEIANIAKIASWEAKKRAEGS